VAKPFVNGGMAATIGITIFNPIDVIKTRLQIAGGGNPFTMGARMVATEGVASLYAGLSAQYLRAWTYQTARLGAYRSLMDAMQPPAGQKTPLWQKAFAGLSAGAFGAMIGNPAELAIIRMQADRTLPEASRRNYSSVVDALVRVVRSEGVLALWTGSAPTIVRAMALNCGALASYDQSKEMIDEMVGQQGSRSGIAGGSMISGIVGAVFSLPFDYVKTQIQRMKPDAVTGALPFSSPWQCFTSTLAEHGPLRFYAGARRARAVFHRAVLATPHRHRARQRALVCARAPPAVVARRPRHIHDSDRADDHAHVGAARADRGLREELRLVSGPSAETRGAARARGTLRRCEACAAQTRRARTRLRIACDGAAGRGGKSDSRGGESAVRTSILSIFIRRLGLVNVSQPLRCLERDTRPGARAGMIMTRPAAGRDSTCAHRPTRAFWAAVTAILCPHLP
jgi:solute carrier family 25 oxoglutarate transporter 11